MIVSRARSYQEHVGVKPRIVRLQKQPDAEPEAYERSPAQSPQFWTVRGLLVPWLSMNVKNMLNSMATVLGAGFDFLVLVELGYVPAPKFGTELLCDVFSSACECSSLIVTCNLASNRRPSSSDRSGSSGSLWIA